MSWFKIIVNEEYRVCTGGGYFIIILVDIYGSEVSEILSSVLHNV